MKQKDGLNFCFFKRMGLLLVLLVLPRSLKAKPIEIHWEALPGAIAYDLEISPPPQKKVPLSNLLLPRWKGELGPGTYAYRIRGVDALDRKGQWTPLQTLVVLPQAPLLKKKEPLASRFSGPPLFSVHWEALPGVSDYPLRLDRVSGSGPPQRVLTTILQSTEWTSPPLPPGDYQVQISGRLPSPFHAPKGSRLPASQAFLETPLSAPLAWHVRAPLPAPHPPPTVHAASPSHSLFQAGSGSWMLGLTATPYAYQFKNTKSGIFGTTQAVSTTLWLQGEHWFWPQWGLQVEWAEEWIELNHQQKTLHTMALHCKYRESLPASTLEWVIRPSLGVALKDYPLLSLPQLFSVSAWGGQIGVELQKHWGDSWNSRLHSAYFIPIKIQGSSQNRLEGAAFSHKNAALGLDLTYHFDRSLSMGVGLAVEKHSLSFFKNGFLNQVQKDGLCFSGVLRYSFGP